MTLIRASALLVALPFTAAWMPAGAAAPPEPVAWSMTIEPASATVKAGGAITAVVTAKLEPGWHVYSVEELPDGPRPLRIVVPAKGAFVAKGALRCAEPERDMDEAFGQVTAFYKADFSCRTTVSAAPGTKAGPQTLAVEISFQACDGRMCLPARIVRLTKPVTVAK